MGRSHRPKRGAARANVASTIAKRSSGTLPPPAPTAAPAMPGAGRGGTGVRPGAAPVERAVGALAASSKTEKESGKVATSGRESSSSPATGVAPARTPGAAGAAWRSGATIGASASVSGATCTAAGATGDVAWPLVVVAGGQVRWFVLGSVVVVLPLAPAGTGAAAFATVRAAGAVALVAAAVAAATAGVAGPALPAVEEAVAAAEAAVCPAVFVT